MSGITIRSPAPAFTAPAFFPGSIIRDISLSKYHGKYLVLFFYPYDFTSHSQTELLELDEDVMSFRRIGARVLAISCDSIYTHQNWSRYSKKRGGIRGLSIPLASDKTASIANSYGVYNEEKGVSFWALFIIDRKGILRHASVSDTIPHMSIASDAMRTLQTVIIAETMGEICHPEVFKRYLRHMEILSGPFNYIDSSESSYSDHSHGYAESGDSQLQIFKKKKTVFTKSYQKKMECKPGPTKKEGRIENLLHVKKRKENEGQRLENKNLEEESSEGFLEGSLDIKQDLNEDFSEIKICEEELESEYVGSRDEEICSVINHYFRLFNKPSCTVSEDYFEENEATIQYEEKVNKKIKSLCTSKTKQRTSSESSKKDFSDKESPEGNDGDDEDEDYINPACKAQKHSQMKKRNCTRRSNIFTGKKETYEGL